MTAKRILYDVQAREAVCRGATILARAVGATLGPRGRLALLARSYGSPNATKDGVTVAKEITLADPYENMGAQVLREVASRAAEEAGDGTTTATVLGEAVFVEGLHHLSQGANAAAIQRGITTAVEAVVADVKARAVPVSGRPDYLKVATIAANGDAEIGKAVADAMEAVGKDGVITVDEAKSTTPIEVEVVNGMQFDRGWLSAHFVTDQKTMRCELENPRILVHEKKLGAAAELLPLLELVLRESAPLVIISEDVEGDALATLVVNKMRGILPCVAVKAPGFGERRTAMLEDLAVLTGARAVTEALGLKLETLPLRDLGRAGKVIIEKENTTIIEGKGERAAIQGRIALIRRELEKATSDYDKEKLQERLAKLSGGVAKIKVGGATEAEMKERKARVDDAKSAAQAAAAEGVVAGGGTALLRAEAAVDKLKLSGDEAIGAQIVRHALSAPLRKIASNAGDNPEVIAERVRKAKGADSGYDARSREIGNLVQAGVIDPAKVVRVALQQAASAGGLLLTVEVAIAEIPES